MPKPAAIGRVNVSSNSVKLIVSAFAVVAALGCSSSDAPSGPGNGGGDGSAGSCLVSATPADCYACYQRSCNSPMNAVVSSCNDFYACMCVNGTYVEANNTMCEPKLTATCTSDDVSLLECALQNCATPCGLSAFSSDGGTKDGGSDLSSSDSSSSGGSINDRCTTSHPCTCPANGECDFVCNGSDVCTATCGAGSTCTLVCGSGPCTLDCASGEYCTQVCLSAQCTGQATDATQFQQNCGTGDCNLTCTNVLGTCRQSTGSGTHSCSGCN